jgi:DNA-binding transcriptional MerR regulator
VGIGDLAKESGVEVVTIRYYEQIGILPRVNRTPGNYRSYGTGTRAAAALRSPVSRPGIFA